MNAKERHQSILTQLELHQKVEIDELSERLDVSTMTIRRDLSILENKNKIIRTPKGATRNQAIVYESSFQHKENKNIELKKEIAFKAVKLVQQHMTIMLDSGTTTLEIAKLLRDFKNVSVITNDIYIASLLINSEIKIILLGGELQNNVGAIFGYYTENMLANMYVDIAFIGTHAIHHTVGITTTSFEKAGIKRGMIKSAEKAYIVADSSKFNERSMIKVCDLEEINGGLITNSNGNHFSTYLDKIKLIN